MRYSNLIAIVLVAPSCFAGGTPASEELQQLLAPINSLQAAFTQTQLEQDGDIIDSQQGQMQASRPGRMRWIIEGDFGQQVITNGETLWIYDPDLEQVTTQSFNADRDNSPALLLMGNFEALSANYQIESGAGEGSYTLVPLEKSAAYQQITIRFQSRQPHSISVLDSLGEQTLIEFDKVVINPELDNRLFEFQPPADVEIIHND